MGYFFSYKIFSDLIPAVAILFCTKFTDLVTILIHKNFFGPLGYLASVYVMVGHERYHHLRFGT